LCCFPANLGEVTVYEVEHTDLTLAMEFAAQFGWSMIWLETDSLSVVLAFKNQDLIPFRLRNRWHNCLQLGFTTICSHIYREGNCCADLLANHGHALSGVSWFEALPSFL